MLIIIGSAQAAPGRRAELMAAARAITGETRGDAGCLTYGFFADLDDPDRIVSVEVWQDQQTLDEHMTHEHTAAFLSAAGGLVAGEPVMAFYKATPSR